MTLINCSWVERSKLRMLSAVTMQTLKRTIQPICADNCISSHDVFLQKITIRTYIAKISLVGSIGPDNELQLNDS